MSFQKFTGLEYLKIDIANNYGLDKEDWDIRIKWFDDNVNNLQTLIPTSDKPALFYAGINAYDKYLKGIPSGYPISLDATASGIQILSVLTGDRKAASLCNVIDTGHREDAYTNLYENMCEQIGDIKKIDRDDTKYAIMTAFYSSTAVPKDVFGTGKLLEVFYETMKENAPGPWEVTEAMLAIWNNEALSYTWIMPDNFNVKIKVMGNETDYVQFLNEPFEVNYTVNKPITKGRSLGANMTHSVDGFIVREMTRRCDYNKEKINEVRNWIAQDMSGTSRSRDNDKIIIKLQKLYEYSGYMSARVLDYIDPANIGHLNKKALNAVVTSLPEKPFKILTVHDCFRTLPNYGNDLRMQYNIILSQIAKSEMLSFLMSQIIKRDIKVAKLDNMLYKDILEANYSLS